MKERIMTVPERQPVLFLPHGGGPCFFMEGSEKWAHMADYLRAIENSLPRKPDAIVVVSGHWETEKPSVTSNAHPPLLYDYNGFPPHTYQLRYPAPGSPARAAQICKLLAEAGIEAAEDEARGFDHGVFIPFMLAFPKADIPIVELSLQRELDPEFHLKIGRALAPLRDENVLIVATGMTYHNLRHFRDENPAVLQASQAFDAWLARTVESASHVRDQALRQWEGAPGARLCHPREEHLLPLMVAAGAAGKDQGARDFRDVIMDKSLSGFWFG